jgi:hypothetical protein
MTLAVAWGGALTTDLARGRLLELYADLGNGWHWEVYRWDRVLGARVLSRSWEGLAPGPYNHGDPAALEPSWGGVPRPDPAAPQEQADVVEGWGFPFRAFGCGASMRMAGEEMQTTTAGVLNLAEPRAPGDGGLYLPLEPLWAGLALDTLLWGLLALVAHALARDARRALARRRAAHARTGPSLTGQPG